MPTLLCWFLVRICIYIYIERERERERERDSIVYAQTQLYLLRPLHYLRE